MTIKKLMCIGTLICFISISCDNNVKKNANSIEVSGVVQKQGMTTYQYGTHTISNYAIRSNTIDLDNYIDKNVTVIGTKIEGYPIDGGPDYLEVEKIK